MKGHGIDNCFMICRFLLLLTYFSVTGRQWSATGRNHWSSQNMHKTTFLLTCKLPESIEYVTSSYKHHMSHCVICCYCVSCSYMHHMSHCVICCYCVSCSYMHHMSHCVICCYCVSCSYMHHMSHCVICCYCVSCSYKRHMSHYIIY